MDCSLIFIRLFIFQGGISGYSLLVLAAVHARPVCPHCLPGPCIAFLLRCTAAVGNTLLSGPQRNIGSHTLFFAGMAFSFSHHTTTCS